MATNNLLYLHSGCGPSWLHFNAKKPPVRATLPALLENSKLERHYSPQQISALWGWSARFVRELFADEPGVLVVNRPEKMNKRGYKSLRIPESVMLRVAAKLQNK
jgi:hypothetical protein